MRVLNDLRLVTKILIPVLLLLVVTSGIVLHARDGLGELAARTQELVDVTAARLEAALTLQSASRNVTIDEKNIILERDQEQLRNYEQRYRKDKTDTLRAADQLIALADTPERREKTGNIKALMQAYFSVTDRSVELGIKNDKEAAIKISQGEASEARKKVRSAIDERVSSYEHDLATAKQEAADLAQRTTTTLIIVAAGGLFGAGALIVAIVVFLVARPLTNMVAAMRRLAEGDLEIQVRDTDRKDEIGRLAGALQVFKDNAVEAKRLATEQQDEQERKARRAAQLDGLTRSFESKAGELVDALASAATEMEATAQGMSSTAEEANQQSVAVAAAAEQASVNVHTVASAAEELASSISEISRQVAQSSRIADQAVAAAKQTDATVRALASGAQKIGDVVTLIQDIAGKTNLLALNATIEAARAGDAGKGFAVVASEVKALAGQTAKATDEIASQIAAIQEATGRTVSAIADIGAVIREISEIGASIAAAVEEQGAATQEIARNVQEAGQGTEQVSSNIVGVKEAATGTGAAAAQVLSAAGDLSRQSEVLRAEVNAFIAGVKAA
ncbi:MAG: HAMP domain-containing protein [Proteobacteria bacterium]|nr:HAMP domain-containing protein [Pseudomonadota bacterium]